jgi:hypothetical protein
MAEGTALAIERWTEQWQARPAMARQRGIAPAWTPDAAVFATRLGVVVL